MRAAELQRLGVGRGTVANAARDALRDAGEAEQVIGKIPVQVRHRAAGDVAVDLRGLFQARNVERLEIGARETRHGPLHQEIGEVGHGIAERRQFPVQHRLHARFRRMENHVVETVVAVDDRGAHLRRHGFRQPLGELLEFRNVLGFRGAVLLGPAIDLAREIIAGLAEITQPDFLGIEHVEFCQRLDLAGEDLAAGIRRLARQRRIPEHPPLFHRHDVEGGADHGIVGAQRVGPGDRKALLAEGCDNAELAIDRMRRRQQLAERFSAHHVGSRRCFELVGRVGLAALELQNLQRPLVALDMLTHPAVEVHLVDAMALLDFLGARELFVFPDAVRHDDAPSNFFLNLGERHSRPPITA